MLEKRIFRIDPLWVVSAILKACMMSEWSRFTPSFVEAKFSIPGIECA